MSELANPTLPAPNTTATGWIKLAPNSKRDFIACFTTSDKVIYTFIGSLSKDVELVSNSATLGYNVASDDLNGTHQVNTATVGTNYFNLDLDNGVTIKGCGAGQQQRHALLRRRLRRSEWYPPGQLSDRRDELLQPQPRQRRHHFRKARCFRFFCSDHRRLWWLDQGRVCLFLKQGSYIRVIHTALLTYFVGYQAHNYLHRLGRGERNVSCRRSFGLRRLASFS
ncbi:hypothetical protein CERSUDRAFT_125029 [Gelatoporia subvermispora B]|uniref:Uncharacterized protein n=1 Tax=Ceriporiopsis subvermispora (strain B) TaxID=914234 RepID=M2R9D5_CERS8|nr:hypothetical protein CERSUDRAFT_125029 [Gelatoporia subvermispora B]